MKIAYLDVLIPGIIMVWLWKRYTHRRRSKGLPYPPGPEGLPFVGNVLDMPTSKEWLKAAEWKEIYGDIVFVENFGKPLIFLNSYEAAVDLLEKRSVIYSSRPRFVMGNELQGWDWFISTMPYGERWRNHRSHLQRFLNPANAVKYFDLQTQDAHKLLNNFLEAPKTFIQHVRNSIGATIMMIAYGREIEAGNDPYITLAEEGMAALAEAAIPGAFLVEIIPWLKYVPAWFPAAGFQKVAQRGNALAQAMRYVPYREVKQKFLGGSAHPSMTSELIEANTDAEGNIKDEEVIANVTGVAYAGGADTLVSTMLTFILAMVINPDVQARAQEEIDRIVGIDRFPTIEDKESLPFVEAVCKEALRWQPVAPLGVPHVVTEDDHYKGYFIPKSSIVIVNQWYLLHDPKEYDDAHSFTPERFLPSSGVNGSEKLKRFARDPAKVAFGFGRRICPGRYMAMNSIFIQISNILAAFSISKAHDPSGAPITPKMEFVSSLISHPVPFECDIVPRDKRRAALVRQAVSEMDACRREDREKFPID